MSPHARMAGIAAACAVLCGLCHAQDGLMPGPGAGTGFSGTLGLGVVHAPRYMGASDSRTRALPMVQLRWGEHWFAGVDGAGYRWNLGQAQAGLRVSFDRGRDEGDAPALRGLGDVPSRAEVGGFASVRLLPFLTVGTGLRYGSGADRDGLVADLGLRAMLPLGDRVRMMLGVSGQWANQASMQSLFGVTAAQSLTTSYAVYQPAAGWRDVGPQLMAMADLGGGWQLMARLDHKTLLGDARRSPLVQDKRSTSSMLMLAWRF